MVDGADAPVRILLNEAGGHRWQRIPPTERSGRVHTSTVTVAVFKVTGKDAKSVLRDCDIETFTTKDSGPGGQHRNKTESAVIMRHRPTGIEANAASKSQHRNRVTAREILEARVTAYYAAQETEKEATKRRSMVGSGMRGDKIRTYRVRDDQVTDHRNNKKAKLGEILAGRLELLAIS